MDVLVRGEDVPAVWLDVVRDAVAFALEAEEAPADVEVGVSLVGEAEMASMNEQYRGVQGPTDVLAFPMDELGAQGPEGREVLLGDIAICSAVAQRQAEELVETVEEELEVLAVHGALHLMGYEHSAGSDARAMEHREQEILTALRRRRRLAGG